MRHSSQTLRRSAAILCASGLAMSGLLLSAPTAFGEGETTNTNTWVNGSNAGQINPATDTSLTIKKYGGSGEDKKCKESESNGTGVAATSETGLPEGCTALAGVEFKITPIKFKGTLLDLSQPGSWDAFIKTPRSGETAAAYYEATDFTNGAAWNPSSLDFKFTLDTENAVTVTTGSDGKAVYKPKTSKTNNAGVTKDAETTTSPTYGGGLSVNDVFLYVEEVGYGKNSVKTPTKSFVVTLPYAKSGTASDAGTWLYDVAVDPKNVTGDAASKKVLASDGSVIPNSTTFSDAGATTAAGASTYTWLIDVPIQPWKSDVTTHSFSVTDTLPTNVVFDSAKASENVKVWTGTTAPTSWDTANALTGTTDYTVDYANGKVTVNFTTTEGNGTDKLTAGNRVYVALKAKVTSENTIVDATNGNAKVENTFSWNQDGSDKTPDPSGTNVTLFGTLNIRKYAPKAGEATAPTAWDKDHGLGGAIFKVYTLKSGQTTAETCDAAADSAINVVGYVQTGSTGEGKITPQVWSGPSDEAVDESNDPVEKTKDFCVEEVKAPGGYKLNDAPFVATLSSETLKTQDVKNERVSNSTIVKLPLTGAAGQLLLTIAGVALIGGGALWLVASRRRRNQDA